jgi:hypothetical protein
MCLFVQLCLKSRTNYRFITVIRTDIPQNFLSYVKSYPAVAQIMSQCFEMCRENHPAFSLVSSVPSCLRYTLFKCYSNRHRIACFKARAKSYNVATRTAEPSRVKTDQNSQHSKTSDVVMVTLSPAVRGAKSFCGPEARNLVMATMVDMFTYLRCFSRLSVWTYLVSQG